MKTYFVGLALVAFVSAVAIQGLHARTTTPPVYVVVEIDEITDADGFEALRKAADAVRLPELQETMDCPANWPDRSEVAGPTTPTMAHHIVWGD